MRKHTCHFDHHQRSRYVTIGLKKRERFYWVLKIDSHKKKLLDKENSSNQPNQSQNQSVIDQGNLITREACLLLKVKRPVLRRSMLVLLAKNLFLQSERCDLSRGPIPGKPVHETSVIQTRSYEDRKDQAHERTGPLIITHDVIYVSDSSETHSAHESETFNVGDVIFRKRTERSVADHGVSHESMMVNEADMIFRIPGPPHSVVKHAQRTSVRELIQKIENHPNRHAIHQDLRQNQSFNPFNQSQNK